MRLLQRRHVCLGHDAKPKDHVPADLLVFVTTCYFQMLHELDIIKAHTQDIEYVYAQESRCSKQDKQLLNPQH